MNCYSTLPSNLYELLSIANLEGSIKSIVIRGLSEAKELEKNENKTSVIKKKKINFKLT